MSIANTCVLIAAVLPIVTMGLAKGATAGKRRSDGGYDNNHPRDWAAKQGGWKARAAAAHSNGFEALPLFVFAVLAAQLAGLDQGRTDLYAMAFIGARLVYTGLYLANVAALRSVVWAVGLGFAIAIFAPTLKLPI
ncbi:MAG: MAPEG family protein [Burkholderiales bacterium]|nr:MAPEG family protein [Burkholderiales bacterium]